MSDLVTTRIDLHMHTNVGSACSMLEIPGMIREAKLAKLDAIVVTDHDNYKGARLARKWGEELDFLVLFGVEVSTEDGDCLVYSEEEFEVEAFSRGPSQKLLDHVQAIGAFMVVAHPFRRSAPSLGSHIFELEGLEAIETINGNCDYEENEKAALAAKRLDVFRTGGSDAHGAGQVGRCYTVFDSCITTQFDLLRELRAGAYKPVLAC